MGNNVKVTSSEAKFKPVTLSITAEITNKEEWFSLRGDIKNESLNNMAIMRDIADAIDHMFVEEEAEEK